VSASGGAESTGKSPYRRSPVRGGANALNSPGRSRFWSAVRMRQSAAMTAITEKPRESLLIRPRTGWAGLDVRELWAYRELLYFFVWRDLKVRYKQTVFGALWAVLQPVLLMVVFTLFLGRLGGIAPSGTPYSLFVFAALVPWTLFSQGLSGASSSVVNATNLVQKVYFPRLLLPIAAIGSYVLDFLIALVVLGFLMAAFGVVPSIAILWVLPFGLLSVVAALGVGVWLAAINVRYRDVRYAVPFLTQVLLFATPVAYGTDLVPANWRAVFELNPMVGVVEGFRWSVLGLGSPPSQAIAFSIAVSGVLLATGLAYFRRVERTFADVI
jgi:lipopolysaccharide transport system permease protein